MLLMDWFKVFTDWIDTPEGIITILIIVLTSIITTAISYIVPGFGQLFKKTICIFSALPRKTIKKLSDYLYWKKYHPLIIVGINEIYCKKIGQRYRLTINIKLTITNNDDAEKITVGFENIRAIAKILNINQRSIEREFTWSEGNRVISLEPAQSSGKISFSLLDWMDTPPKIGQKVLCKFKNTAQISMRGERAIKWDPQLLTVVSTE